MSDEPINKDKIKRPRIQVVTTEVKAVIDPLVFTKNMSTGNARKINSSNKNFTIDLWGDKHYFTRAQIGDDDGQRLGIDHDAVSDLIFASINHLLFYSSCLEKFSFLNHDCERDNIRNKRIVCQKDINGNYLNVVIEVHHFGHCRYEITVRTALTVNGFKISDGQYCLELLDNETSILRKMENGKLKEIYKN